MSYISQYMGIRDWEEALAMSIKVKNMKEGPLEPRRRRTEV